MYWHVFGQAAHTYSVLTCKSGDDDVYFVEFVRINNIYNAILPNYIPPPIPQWVPETTDCNKPYRHDVFSYVYTSSMLFPP
jgi:hypothetical protein